MSRFASVRFASSRDISALAELAERTFRAAFEADNAPDDMEAYVRDAFSESRLLGELADATNTFLVATRDERLVGYAKLRTGPPPSCLTSSRPVELHRLYVEPEAIGHGIGAALMRECVDRARAGAFDAIWLGVWQHNARAIAFYERWGFEAVGEQTFQLGSDAQTDLILQRTVVS